MGSGKEKLVADETSVETGAPLTLSGQGVVPEGESDDEYEEVPKRQEKQRKVEHASAETAQHLVAAAGPVVAKDATMETGDAPTNAALGSAEELNVADKDATDDDWLRSRTNRLLDLVDPDDLPKSQPSSDAKGGPTQQLGTAADVLPTHHVVAEAESSDTPQPPAAGNEKESPIEAISRTARLFVRNLAYSATEDDLRDCFEKFGTVEEVRFVYSPSLTPFRSSCRVAMKTVRHCQHDEPQIGTAYALEQLM